jgi:nitrogen fixation/metabolism regulation signal transduction histidine kinase
VPTIRPRFSKFEIRILLAILVCALTPFVISVIFIPQIVESRFALSIHPKVQDQLEASALFYKEFFDAKKSEFAARAETISRDPVLVRAAKKRSVEDTHARLDQIIADNADIRAVRVYLPEGDQLAESQGPPERQTQDFVPKQITLPLGVGEPPRVEIEFLLANRYLADREHAEEIATLYGTSLKIENERQELYFRTYILINAAVVLMALGIGYFLARRVTKRIARLAMATERVAKGESGFTIPLRGNDEITELSARFNRMIEEVAEARDRIVYLEKVSGWQDFARRLAHEIKNPLTPIRLAIQELRRRAPEGDPAFRRLVDDASDVVEEEIGALTRLVDEFSQFARLPEVIPTYVEVRSYLEEFLSAYNRFEPDAEVFLSVPDKPVKAAIDRVLMRRVLSNLCMNAIQAAGKGKAKLWIFCAVVSPNESVEIRIEDNGPGIQPSMAEKIFEPYFTTKAEGTGLGLAIVKKIVLQHEGTITIKRSMIGGGAAFVIVLPAPERMKNVVKDRAESSGGATVINPVQRPQAVKVTAPPIDRAPTPAPPAEAGVASPTPDLPPPAAEPRNEGD